MLQHEFEERVGIKVSAKEYEAIEVVYMYADETINKDEFCKMWKQLNKARIKSYKAKQKAKQENEEHLFRMKVLNDKLRNNIHKDLGKLLSKRDISDINKANLEVTKFDPNLFKVIVKKTSELTSDIFWFIERQEKFLSVQY